MKAEMKALYGKQTNNENKQKKYEIKKKYLNRERSK